MHLYSRYITLWYQSHYKNIHIPGRTDFVIIVKKTFGLGLDAHILEARLN